MNIGAWMCGVLVISFAAIGLLFGLFKEKATKCVAGFNTFSEKEQAMYDRAAISLDIRNQCFLWSAIMLAGTVFSLVLLLSDFLLFFFLFLLSPKIKSVNEKSAKENK